MVPIRVAFLWLNLIYVLHFGKSAMDKANWMSNNIKWLGKLTLMQLCLAGSHNSGMNQFNGGTPNVKGCKVLTQDLTVQNQLEKGVRYLDVRPVLSEGKFMTGNYDQNKKNVWEGGYGQSIESIVEDINNFTKQHNELIIITLSHTLNTDVEEYRPFNQEDWNKLFDLLNSTKNLFHAPETSYLQIMTLGEITNNGNRSGVFYIVYDRGTGVELGDLAGKGYFCPKNIHIYQSETDTDDPFTMLDDQVWQMEKVSPMRYFVLSFVVSLSPIKLATCTKKRNNRRFAQRTNQNLRDIMTYVTNVIHPNVIAVDFVGDSQLAEVVMSVNLRWLSKTALESLIKG